MTASLAVIAVGVYFLARWSWRWFLLALGVVIAVVFLIVLPWRYPSANFLDPDLPPLFLNHFWSWVGLFVAGITYSTVFLVRALRSARPSIRADATPATPGGFPELDAAWEEILV